MKTFRTACLLPVLVLCGPILASAQGFFDSFMKPEYLVPVSDFPATSGGDLNLTYYQIPIPVMKNGELLILGEFPRSRYFSITAYDDHGAVIGALDDKDIHPYGSAGNPYQAGGPAGAEDVLYAITVRLDTPMALTPLAQCSTPLDVHQNVLDARSRHTAGTFYSASQSGFSATVAGYGTVTHADAPTNSGAFIMIRNYQTQPPASTSRFDLRKPLVWVRSASTGCAPQLAPTGQSLTTSQWFSLSSVLKLDQVQAHMQHETDLGTSAPYGLDPAADATWFGREEYQPGQSIGRYLAVPIASPNTPSELNAQGRVLQLQFRLPSLPCNATVVCGFTGDEDLRYWSLTFEDQAGKALGSLTELGLTRDANGYVTMVVTFGASLPDYVRAANGYSPFVLRSTAAARVVLRNYVPAAAFECSTWNVPVRTAEYTPNGGYMGEYAPLVTFPTAAALPAAAVPLVRPDNCSAP